MNRQYIYETHMHTSQASACGRTPGREYIRRYMDEGYAGIIITDHFYRGNCGVDRSLPWKDFVRSFMSGYEDARNEGEKQGFPVFFGWEENYDGDEYLIYGLDEDFLLAHPEMIAWTRRQQYDAVRAAGGCVVQAHPFRSRSYNHDIYLSPFLCDGVEGFNGGNEERWNSQALRYAGLMGLPITAGTDNHSLDHMVPGRLAGIALDRPLESIQDYVQILLNKRPISLFLPSAPAPWQAEMTPDLPAHWLDREGNDTGLDVEEILKNGPKTR